MADIHIYFGSQSGTAESFSEDLKEEVEQNGMTAEVGGLPRELRSHITMLVFPFNGCQLGVRFVTCKLLLLRQTSSGQFNLLLAQASSLVGWLQAFAETRIAVMVVATYGDGEPSETCRTQSFPKSH
eukprot:Skav203508  [mRNA]  locus=scaffold2089:220879:221420:- [translate_table: standard]